MASSPQGYWRRVIAELGTGWRHITLSRRARGRSKRSADYSFEAAVRDVDAVLAARGVDRALVVGWSYGAVVGAHWASRNPERALGAVLVEASRSPTTGSTRPWNSGSGSCSGGWAGSCRCCARRAWPRGSPPNSRRTATSSSAGSPASANWGPVLDDITVPVRYVVASGTSFGSRGDERERIRTGLDAVTARNPNIQISAKVAGNHGAILKKDFPSMAGGRTRGRHPRPRGADGVKL